MNLKKLKIKNEFFLISIFTKSLYTNTNPIIISTNNKDFDNDMKNMINEFDTSDY